MRRGWSQRRIQARKAWTNRLEVSRCDVGSVDSRPNRRVLALNDSCADLAAWIVEKFRAWGDCGKYRISIFHETNFKRWRGSGKWATQGEINYAAKFSGGRFENSAPQSGEFNQRRLLIIKLVESLAVDGVFREPVSRITSLLTGKNTGKFIKVDLLRYPDCPDEPRIRALCTRFPANRNREFSKRKQRMQFSKQGIYPMIVTIDHMPVV